MKRFTTTHKKSQRIALAFNLYTIIELSLKQEYVILDLGKFYQDALTLVC